MKLELSAEQVRVLGVMLEKQITTPDQYPMSINAITTACNQKSNRDPVVQYSEVDVQNVVDELIQQRLLADAGPSGRVNKYRHRFYGSEFSAFNFDSAQAAILCLLFVRGPQTPGELRTRSQRLNPFNDVGQVEACLNELANAEDGPFVVKLAREPGKREHRFGHLFSGEVAEVVTEAHSLSQNSVASTNSTVSIEEFEQLKAQVNQLTVELAELKQQLGAD
ncbi:hypothetical protein DS2_02770 [Catenovulum agarivorans DS-2]|uniref:Uncharacterized protein n=1 Tax=Catenovulum agarivorans DS-2 TaxID=1328313 RepID=W7QIN4_9ALTE|nr:DUF480 domain-containing protein [Catenovulum agarivorans]EWH11711.1 hypothetical protein DS2_02770 [Catenovulum agarivorans DS-2]